MWNQGAGDLLRTFLRIEIESWLTHSNDTSHDNWYNTLHHQVGSQNGHGRDSNA